LNSTRSLCDLKPGFGEKKTANAQVLSRSVIVNLIPYRLAFWRRIREVIA
jgi:hypothetical protein